MPVLLITTACLLGSCRSKAQSTTQANQVKPSTIGFSASPIEVQYLNPNPEIWFPFSIDDAPVPHQSSVAFMHTPIPDRFGRGIQPVLSIRIWELEDGDVDLQAFSRSRLGDLKLNIEKRSFAGGDRLLVHGTTSYSGYTHKILVAFLAEKNIAMQILCDSTDSVFPEVESDFLAFAQGACWRRKDGKPWSTEPDIPNASLPATGQTTFLAAPEGYLGVYLDGPKSYSSYFLGTGLREAQTDTGRENNNLTFWVGNFLVQWFSMNPKGYMTKSPTSDSDVIRTHFEWETEWIRSLPTGKRPPELTSLQVVQELGRDGIRRTFGQWTMTRKEGKGNTHQYFITTVDKGSIVVFSLINADPSKEPEASVLMNSYRFNFGPLDSFTRLKATAAVKPKKS